jgi:hypothetical protein
MSDTLYRFEQGPYDILDYHVKKKNGKAVIEVNDTDLGRLPIEDLETVEQLRQALDEVEHFLKEKERREEEL